MIQVPIDKHRLLEANEVWRDLAADDRVTRRLTVMAARARNTTKPAVRGGLHHPKGTDRCSDRPVAT